MIISIDTKQDSPDDIRKAISMLRSLIGEQDTITTPAQAPPAQDVSFASLFDSAPEMQGASTDLSGDITRATANRPRSSSRNARGSVIAAPRSSAGPSAARAVPCTERTSTIGRMSSKCT